MHVDRLLKLAALLRKDADNKKGVKFDLAKWGLRNTKKTKRFSVSCGTTACAIGLACVSGVFKKEGLGFTLGPAGGKYQEIIPVYDGNEHWYAVNEFFDISIEQAEYLFSKFSNADAGPTRGRRGELRVAQRIEDVVGFATA